MDSVTPVALTVTESGEPRLPPPPPPRRPPVVPVTRTDWCAPEAYGTLRTTCVFGPERSHQEVVLPVATPRDLVVQLRGTAAAVMSIAAFAGLKCGGSNEDICYGQYFAKPNNDGGAGRDFVVSGSYVRIAAVRAELVREGEKKVADDERSQKTSARSQQRANIIPFPLVAALDFLESHTFPSLLSSLSSTDRWVPPRRPVSWLAELHEGFQLQCATEEAEWATMPGKQQAGSRGGKKGESRGKSWGEGRGEGWGEGKEGGEDKNEDVCEDDVCFYSDRAQQEH